MLGSFRFFLALCVVVYHLSGKVPTIGLYAVECFYVISGYLMTIVLHETYRFRALPFIENRFLRLYPAYYAIALLTIAIFLLTPPAQAFHGAWQWDGKMRHIASNLLIFPWSTSLTGTYGLTFRVIPPTWSVAIEIACYAALWLFVARRWWTALLTLCALAIWHANTFLEHAPWEARYYTVTGSLLAFSVGSSTYWLANCSEKWRNLIIRGTAGQYLTLGAAIILFMLNWWSSLADVTGVSCAQFYINMLIAALTAVAFHRIRGSGLPGMIERWLGELSYPVFLAQFTGGYLTWRLLGSPPEIRSWLITIGAIAISVTIGFACVLLIDRPIQAQRIRIRKAASSGKPLTSIIGTLPEA